ncbi:hypothetical protein [Nannocystis pusilla]|uniref:hypothetical protein n=1 Tax=Nannocystis pusilla TaxID=889268 RepID=UPI003DA49F36
MARKLPPQHRADVPGIYIPRSDSSFDRDRFDRELKQLEEAGEAKSSHPIERYYAGHTRYDLQATDLILGQAVKVADYFRAGDEPEKWILRRLTWDQWHRVMALIEQGQLSEAQLLACRLGIADVQNSPIKLEGTQAGLLTHADMQRIHDADAQLALLLGFAVWMYSKPLTDQEKKV